MDLPSASHLLRCRSVALATKKHTLNKIVQGTIIKRANVQGTIVQGKCAGEQSYNGSNKCAVKIVQERNCAGNCRT
jgi:hypothetical protein